jgi:hypothetical protein
MFFVEGADSLSANAKPSSNEPAVNLPKPFLFCQNGKPEPVPTRDGTFTFYDGPLPGFPAPAGLWSSWPIYDETTARPKTIEEELQDFIGQNFNVDESWGTDQPRG